MTADGFLYCIMVGCGEAYIGAFAVALGIGEILAGLIASVPLVVGGTLQLVTPWAVRMLGSLRRWVLLCAIVQALSFAPLAIGAWRGSMPAWLLYLVVSVYWTVNYAQGPAWNTWVTTLVPPRIRARYFAQRTRVTQVGTVIGLVGAGLALNSAKGEAGTVEAVAVFALLFGVAGTARLIACRCLAGQREPEPIPPDFRTVSPRQFLSRWRTGHDVRLIGYMLAVQVMVQISGPFFTPFMLVRLKLSYLEYMVLIATSYFARMVVLPSLGRLAHARGPRIVLLLGGIGLIPSAALWAVSGNFWYLMVIQFCTGAAWACYEIATFLLLFETIPAAERTSVLSLFNFGNTVAIVSGSCVGATLLHFLGDGTSSYHILFVVSSSMRLLTVPLLLLLRVPKFEAMPIPAQPLSVRPAMGSFDRPLIAGMEEDRAMGGPELLAAGAVSAEGVGG
ncbi:MAG: MFS transporter [Phycisphaerales bacterium]|nr:MFS transporter [Phycisphaerales bacterium]